MQNDSTIHIWPIEDETEQNGSLRRGASWRVVQEAWPQLTLLQPPPDTYKVIIDANMVLADLRYKYLHPDEPVLLEVLFHEKMIDLWAPHWLITELRCGTAMMDFLKKYPELTRENLWSQWPALQKIIKFDRRFDYPLRLEMFGVTDIKDEPYVATAKAHKALGILSRDAGFQALRQQHLMRQDLRVIEELSAVFEKAIGAKIVTIGAPTAAMFGAGSGVYSACKKISSMPEKAQWAFVAAGVGLGLLWMHPKSRKFIKDTGQKTGKALKPIWDGYQQITEEGFLTDRRIKELVFEIEKGRI